jgi:hypothetical protein
MTTEYKKATYDQWVENMEFMYKLIGEKFKQPVKPNGKPEDDVEILWNWYQNYNNNLAKELRK